MTTQVRQDKLVHQIVRIKSINVNLPAFLNTSRFLFVDPISGQIFVFSIELHEELHDLDGVEEQHREDKSEKH